MKFECQFCLVLCSILNLIFVIEPTSVNFQSENNEDHKASEDSFGSRRKSKSPVATDNEAQSNYRCAVMYKNNEPVGILEPYEDSFRILPVDKKPTFLDTNLAPEKRIVKDVQESAEDDESKGFPDNSYPAVFTKFRIDSRMNELGRIKSDVKRSLIRRDEPDKESNADYDAVEEELGRILDEMSLIDDSSDLDLQHQAEDEDLEHVNDKMNLEKDEHRTNRHRRNEIDDILRSNGIPLEILSGAPKVDAIRAENDVFSDNKHMQDRSIGYISPAVASKESLTTIQDCTDKHTERPDSSLADCDAPNSLEKEFEDNSKRVERGIRDKIKQLKNEVWKAIDELKKSKSHSDKHVVEDNQRKKRQIVNTLLDEENIDIDPNFNEEEDERVHIRRKRDI